jgi:membrane-bound lytic murein transglycosylase A
MFKFFLLTFTALLLQGCLFHQKITIKGKGNLQLSQVDFQLLNGWENDDHKKALQALIQSCNKFSKMSQSRSIGGQIADITAGDFRDVCDIAQVVKTMNSKQARNFFENWFKPFLVEKHFGGNSGLFTGYYEASLMGSRVKSEKFQYPIYARPKDLKNEPYLSRKEIESGGLKGKGLELLYVDDRAELFAMHIQGSGRVTLPDGNELRVAYAGRNNHPFVAVSNYMADKGYLKRSELNAASVKQWLKNNPDKADEVMNVNAAYTFFKISDGEYVVGAQGVPLTPERSLAVDSEVIPYGMPLWVETSLKEKNGSREKYSHLFVAQDTGSAIKGITRGDIFFGYGKEAEEKASYMAAQGEYYILLPINVVDKLRGI